MKMLLVHTKTRLFCPWKQDLLYFHSSKHPINACWNELSISFSLIIMYSTKICIYILQSTLHLSSRKYSIFSSPTKSCKVSQSHIYFIPTTPFLHPAALQPSLWKFTPWHSHIYFSMRPRIIIHVHIYPLTHFCITHFSFNKYLLI